MLLRRCCAIVAAFVLLTTLNPVPATEIGQEIAGQINVASYRHYLDDVLYTHNGHNRGRFGAQHDPARNNIYTTFQSFGLEVELHPFYYGGTYYNVVATQRGCTYPDSEYIIGGHYDSVNNPGADDNASGVAGVMEIARVLSQYPTQYTVRYIAFDLEELGLLGSDAYAQDHVEDDIRGMISMDMIAYDAGDYAVQIFGRTSSNPIKSALSTAVLTYGGDLSVHFMGSLDASDHAPFEWVGFRACLLIEMDGNPCYHQQCDSVDTPDYISYDYAVDQTRSVAGFLADHALALARDCDGDGLVDKYEIDANPSLDCNENDRLDVCEVGGTTDCNGNGEPDLCDVYSGVSEDANGAGIPDECQDLAAPLPNPMQWAPGGQPSPAYGVASQLAMTAVEAFDPEGVEYGFECVAGGCHNSAWQASTSYVDVGLAPNSPYTYAVRARDQSPLHNATSPSNSVQTVTSIESPTTVEFVDVGDTTLQVYIPGVFTNLSYYSSGIYIEVTHDGATAGGGDANTWKKSQSFLVTGLSEGTLYTLRVKARNLVGFQTPYSAAFERQTTGGQTCVLLGDMNGDGMVDGSDVPGFVRAKLGQPAMPGDNAACADYQTGSTAGDVAAFVDDLLS